MVFFEKWFENDHIINWLKGDNFERKRRCYLYFAEMIDINWEYPRKTEVYGHPNSFPLF